MYGTDSLWVSFPYTPFLLPISSPPLSLSTRTIFYRTPSPPTQYTDRVRLSIIIRMEMKLYSLNINHRAIHAYSYFIALLQEVDYHFGSNQSPRQHLPLRPNSITSYQLARHLPQNSSRSIHLRQTHNSTLHILILLPHNPTLIPPLPLSDLNSPTQWRLQPKTNTIPIFPWQGAQYLKNPRKNSRR